MDGGQDVVEEIARDRDLGQLGGDRAGMPHDAGADRDEPGLEARQRLQDNLVGQVGGLQEHAELVHAGCR